jgi:hypothetical protein
MGGVLTSMCGIFNPAAAAGYITSIQQVSITIASSATTGTATITSVDTSKAYINWAGNTTAATSGAGTQDFPRVTLTNATTVTATRNTSTSAAVVVNVFVIEGTSNLIGSIQQGTITISSGTSNTATITSVDTSRSVVFYNGNTTTNGDYECTYDSGAVTLTNATTVTAYIGQTKNVTVGYVVVEFASAAISSVQRFTDAYTTSNSTDTKTITSVNTSRSIIAWGGNTALASDWDNFYGLQLTSSTNVNLVRSGTGTGSRAAYYTVVEFASGVINSIQRGSITIAGGSTSNTATITTINTAKSFLSLTGYATAYISFFARRRLPKLVLTNSTTITADRNQSDATLSNTPYYEAVEFT